jgi:hypothetical protein
MSSQDGLSESQAEDDGIDDNTLINECGNLHRNMRKLIDNKKKVDYKNSLDQKHLSARYRITKYEQNVSNTTMGSGVKKEVSSNLSGNHSEKLLTQRGKSELPKIPKSPSNILLKLKEKTMANLNLPNRDLTNRQISGSPENNRPESREFFENILGNIEQISKESAEALKLNPPKLSLRTLSKIHTHRDFFVKQSTKFTDSLTAVAATWHQPVAVAPPPPKSNFIECLMQHSNLIPKDEVCLIKLKTVLPEALECIAGNRHTVLVLDNWYTSVKDEITKTLANDKIKSEASKKNASLLVLLDLIRQSFAHCTDRGRLMLQSLSEFVDFERREQKSEGDLLKKQLRLEKAAMAFQVEGLKHKINQMEEKETFASLELQKQIEALKLANEREEELLDLQVQ